MKVTLFPAAAAFIAALCWVGGATQAQESASLTDLDVVSSASVIGSSNLVGSGIGYQSSCSDDCTSCDSKPTCGCQSCASDPCEPWHLFGTTCRGVQVGGWISGGATINGHGNRTGTGNAPLGFNNVADGLVLNQLWAYAVKEADTGGCGTDWGFRVDYVFGADGPDTQAFGDEGFDFGWNSSRDYGSAIPQLYFELAYNDLSVKLGHFYTNVGYEVVQATGNFFYSHSYTQYYGEPFTHTGVLASYQYTDQTELLGGWTMGWDSGFDNFNDASTFLGGIAYTVNNYTTLTWAVVAGDFGDGTPNNNGDIYMNSIVLDIQLTDRLEYVLQHDLGINDGLGAGDNEWYGVNQYLFYTINDCWALGGRVEWFRDDDGARIGVNGAGAGNYYGATAGVNWSPRANLRVRPEVRWDWFDGMGLPFDNGTRDEMFTFGIDAVFTF